MLHHDNTQTISHDLDESTDSEDGSSVVKSNNLLLKRTKTVQYRKLYSHNEKNRMAVFESQPLPISVRDKKDDHKYRLLNRFQNEIPWARSISCGCCRKVITGAPC